MSLRSAPILLFLATLGVWPVRAQVRPNGHAVYSIDGSVRDDSDQHEMENVRVDLRQSGGVPINSTFTRDNGEFSFGGLPVGDYQIEINLKDYEPLRQSVTVFNSSLMGVTLFLKRSAKWAGSPGAANPIQGATISAHQLSVPHKAYDEFEKGMALFYVKSDYRGAIEQFQRAIKDFPTYYEAYAEEGGAYYRLGEMAPAEEALRKSIDLSSKQYPDAIFSLATILNDSNRYTDAADMARRGMATDTSSWRGPFELARALTGLKQTEEAEKNAVRSRDLMPDNPAVYLMLANIHIQRRDLPALLRDLDEYLRLAPNGLEAERARRTREQVHAILNPPADESAASGKEKPQPGAKDKDSHLAPGKDSPPPPEPDTSGLPSLPPPSSPNP